ncbi:unnamed protein product, partial [Ectocarpus sp. 12 AP-2014]
TTRLPIPSLTVLHARTLCLFYSSTAAPTSLAGAWPNRIFLYTRRTLLRPTSFPGLLATFGKQQLCSRGRRNMEFRRSAALALVGLLAATSIAAAADTPSPNEPIPKPDCDSDIEVSIRYAESTARLYLESADNGTTRGGCVTLGQIWESRAGKGPLYAVDPDSGNVSTNATGTWLLTEELYVEDGITLEVYGSEAGGDADELRLLSTNETFINLR